MRREPTSLEVQEALMARARRARDEAMAATVRAAAKSLWTQVLKLQRVRLTVRPAPTFTTERVGAIRQRVAR
jgi:hypothetical protein